MFKSYPKNPRVKNRKYLDWVDLQGCVICVNQSKAHHICNTGNGSMSSKPDDYLTFALCSRHHMAWFDTGIHKDVTKWENQWQPQAYFVIDTLNNALDQNIITSETWEKYIEICENIIDCAET